MRERKRRQEDRGTAAERERLRKMKEEGRVNASSVGYKEREKENTSLVYLSNAKIYNEN